MNEDELMAFMAEHGFGQSYRHRFRHNGSEFGVSILLGTSPEKVQEIEQECIRASDRMATFHALPELEQVKYHLAQAYKALKTISTKPHWPDNIDVARHTLSNIHWVADLACSNIPEEYKTTEVEI